ncbi:O-antigen ligase family protein [Gordonia sp. WA4-43]|uniref:O-antigen ligase family protein n=1 Tax=Gordonia sp. WA4-43 TaxID=2878678 RepID=UPI001CFB12F8|nr:O-antigen ligase family protein [Gordonia sp. WA4-43]UCZ91846.1 O-antigen ligase family protein [Gordonia sp. WA4-43]
MASTAALAAAFALFLVAGFDRTLLTRLDRYLCVWLASITAWPVVIIYGIAPIIWASAEAAGPLFAILMYGPAAALSIVAALRAISARKVSVDYSAAILGLLLLYGGSTMVIDGSQRIINLITAAALFVGFIFRYRSFELHDVADAARVALIVTAAILTLSVAFNSSRVVGACRIDKCTELGAALTSPFAGNGNLAGIMVTALLPFAMYRLALWRIIAAILGVALIGMLAGSRTAFGGIAVAGALGLLLAIGPLAPRVRNLVLGVALIGGLAYSSFPLYIGYSTSDYSLRGILWDHARQIIPDQWFFGHNPAYWVESGTTQLFEANYSPHNGWLEILVSVGVFGALLIVIAAVIKVATLPGADAQAYVLTYLITMLVLSSLEAVYVPYFLSIAPFAAILPYFIYREPASVAYPKAHASSEQEFA